MVDRNLDLSLQIAFSIQIPIRDVNMNIMAHDPLVGSYKDLVSDLNPDMICLDPHLNFS